LKRLNRFSYFPDDFIGILLIAAIIIGVPPRRFFVDPHDTEIVFSSMLLNNLIG